MSDPTPEPTPESQPTPTAVKPKRNRQDTEIANNLAQWLDLLNTILNNQDLLTAVTPNGYTPEKLQLIRTHTLQTLTAYQERDKAILNQQEALAILTQAVQATRETLADYRQIIRPAIQDPAHRAALRLNIRPPYDLQKFIVEILTAYQNNHDLPELLNQTAPLGYTTDRLATFIADLHTLTNLRSAADQARATAVAATQHRNDTYTALKAEINQLRAIIRVVAKKRPEWSGLL